MSKAVLSAGALAVTAVLLTGCGNSGDSGSDKGTDAQSAPTSNAQSAAPSRKPPASAGKGLDGTWRSIVDSPIATLTIAGTKVTTTGKLACPGTLTGLGTAKQRIVLTCDTPQADRAKGTVNAKADGTAIAIEWDGPAWGGVLDSFRRA